MRYSVGALLYSPALNDKIASSILNGQFGKTYSVALCLEDTIADSAVGQALEQLGNTFKTLHLAFATHDVTLPKIFVRVRNPEQISVVYQKISCFDELFSGFIFPKYSLANADEYNSEFLKVLSQSSKQFYMMPILESEDIVDYATRPSVLIQLKQKIDDMKDHVLNVRVGGNDFSNAFGVRRHIDETIYDILPVSQLLCDILTVFSRDYVVSGPVWEYYSSNNDEWAIGLKRELKYDVLHDITFSPVPGGKTAIVGPSGSGKSTITKLMAGFWDVTSGHIIYGCQDIRNIPTSQLMKHISFVSQDNFLFNISIKENIRMGNPCATDEEVLAAAKAARCDEFIRKMEYGYDTLVGDAGGKLSGGERQRITIARAILKPADVVILDEASAYADPENEVYIEEAINELVKDKTLIVVAHRLETIENSDKIVVVDQGKIVAEGTQSELLKNCALYKRLWNETILTSERKRGECNA